MPQQGAFTAPGRGEGGAEAAQAAKCRLRERRAAISLQALIQAQGRGCMRPMVRRRQGHAPLKAVGPGDGAADSRRTPSARERCSWELANGAARKQWKLVAGHVPLAELQGQCPAGASSPRLPPLAESLHSRVACHCYLRCQAFRYVTSVSWVAIVFLTSPLLDENARSAACCLLCSTSSLPFTSVAARLVSWQQVLLTNSTPNAGV